MCDSVDVLETGNPINKTKTNCDTPQHKKKIEDYFVRDDKNMLSRSVQVNMEVSLDDDVSLRIQSNNYWFIQAEEKRIQLELALKENERLCKLKATLKEENLHFKQMLDEVQSLIDVYHEVVEDAGNDTGIELSTSDESQENCNC